MNRIQKLLLFTLCCWGWVCCKPSPQLPADVSAERMQEMYERIKTPFKYGVVFQHSDTSKLVDSPTIFRYDDDWYMTYIVFDGKGYETWLAKSSNLLDWEEQGRLLSFTPGTWDANQKAGYLALVDIHWGAGNEVARHEGNYWMSYLGGATEGYEAGTLGVGMAKSQSLVLAEEWERIATPVLLPGDSSARWFETDKIYKSHIIRDEDELTGYPFVMYYNAKGDTATYESIGMAGSRDMVNWTRIGDEPVITRGEGICGDAQIVKIDDLYVMFYFGAFWKPGAFERFACSYDLLHWTDWEGEDLVSPSEPYDSMYAHKPWVIHWEGVTYHFYNAVGDQGRVIALATSVPLN